MDHVSLSHSVKSSKTANLGPPVVDLVGANMVRTHANLPNSAPPVVDLVGANSIPPKKVSPTTKESTPQKERFKANVRTRSRNTCRLCEEHFEIPLTVAYHGGGYICERCRRDGAPSETAKADSQTKIEAA